MSGDPRMSVVLVTDRYETIRGVVQRLARQTVADQIELVITAPSGAGVEPDPADVAPLHGHRSVEIDDIIPLWRSRAAGMRAATAPVITVGETHALPRAEWAETVLAAFDAGRSVVVPGIANANPDGAISWSGLLSDYGRWSRALPAREVGPAPAHNTSFARDFIEGLGDRLDELHSPGFDVGGAVRDQGRAVWHEPRAVLYHINVSRIPSWWRERYLHARVMATRRARPWSGARRLVYICGSPLIVPLVLRRIWPGYRATRAAEAMPRMTVGCLAVGAVFMAIGEVMGLVFGATDAHVRGANEMEIHKLRYTRHGVRGLAPDDV